MKVLTSEIILLFIICLRTAQPIRLKHFEGIHVSAKNLSESRVIGGTPAGEVFAPYQVSLRNLKWGTHACGGAIINKTWVLTAGHCVRNANSLTLGVVTGTNQWDQPGAIYYIDRIYKHCNYNKPSLHNDIALLHLNATIVFNEKTQPVPLPSEQMEDGDEPVLTGWGSTVLWGDTPDILQKVTLKYVSHKKCKRLLKDDPDLDIGHICTLTKEGEGTCHGDSGGPLVFDGHLVGIVNWGYPCAIGLPDTYASTLFYHDWIRSIMSGNPTCNMV